jgi:hypothetical protein
MRKKNHKEGVKEKEKEKGKKGRRKRKRKTTRTRKRHEREDDTDHAPIANEQSDPTSEDKTTKKTRNAKARIPRSPPLPTRPPQIWCLRRRKLVLLGSGVSLLIFFSCLILLRAVHHSILYQQLGCTSSNG